MSLTIHTIDEIYFRIAKIRTFVGELALTNATGFFYMHECFLYLVTSRHVVLNEVEGHRPDRLQLSLHSNQHDLRQRAELSIPLYKDGVPQWYQHPVHTSCVDVVAVAVNDPNVSRDHDLATFARDDIVSADSVLPLGQQVHILGFPLGFHDTVHNLPIVRSATIASSYPHPFKGEPYFLTDARLHRGMSGSPVIAQLGVKGDGDAQQKPKWRLLGIHSSALDVSDRDPEQDEKLALNTTWYASLLPQMIPPSLVNRHDAAKRRAIHH
jgi:hypothetical protein